MIIDIIFGFIFMIILVLLSAIPIFVAAYFTKKNGGYSKEICWVLTVVSVILYIVIRVLIFEVLKIQDSGNPVPILAMLFIYGLANIFSKKQT